MIAMIGLVIAVLLMLVGARKKVNVGLTALAGAIIMALASKDAWQVLKNAFMDTFLEPSGYDLLIAIALITVLGNTMKVSGALEQLTASIRGVARDPRIITIVVPALFSFLNVPGAAVFSAPIVDSAGDQVGMTKEQKVVANIFFRHIPFFFYPLYPAYLLTRQMVDLPFSYILWPGLAGALVAFIVASYLAFRGTSFKRRDCAEGIFHNSELAAAQENSHSGTFMKHFWQFIRTFIPAYTPLIIILFLALFLHLPFSLCILAGIVTAVFIAPTGSGNGASSYMAEVRRRVTKGVLKGLNWELAGAIAGIVFFSNSILHSAAVDFLSSSMSGSGASIIILASVVPFLTGFFIGLHQGAVAVTLPLLISAAAGRSDFLYLVVMLYFASMMGYILSPAHVCVVGTVEYLKADFMKSWRLAWIPVVCVLALLAVGVVFLQIGGLAWR